MKRRVKLECQRKSFLPSVWHAESCHVDVPEKISEQALYQFIFTMEQEMNKAYMVMGIRFHLSIEVVKDVVKDKE